MILSLIRPRTSSCLRSAWALAESLTAQRPLFSVAASADASTSTSSAAAPAGKHTVLLTDSTSPDWPVQHPNQKLMAKYSPWEITRSLAKKSGYQRRMRFLVQALDQERVQASQQARAFPDFKSGDILEVRMLVPENQRRQYIYRGVCIARYNKGICSSFKLYNVYPDGGPVIQHIPLYMPDLVSIEVVGKVQAGSRVKKYHILENDSSKYSFQKQVKVVKADGADDGKAVVAPSATKKAKS